MRSTRRSRRSRTRKNTIKTTARRKRRNEKLTEQIGLAQTELTYIDSVFESLALAENERDLNEIRAELAEQGYVRRKAGKKNQKQPALSAPLKFKTSDGFTVLVGAITARTTS